MNDIIKKRIMESIESKQKLIETELDKINECVKLVINSYKKGGKLVIFGNGGSAADAQHIAAELVNKLYINRPMLDAIALTVNTSILTAISNDSSYNDVFVRQIETLVKPNDVIIGLSTSGNSTNVNKALIRANQLGITTIGFTGVDGGEMNNLGLNVLVKVPSKDVARIQENHITIGHVICELVEKELFGSELTENEK